MLSLSHLKTSLHLLFKIASKDSVKLKVTYKEKVYYVTIEPTNEKYRVPNYKPRFKARKGAILLTPEICPECEYMVIGGVCINKKCPTNIGLRPKT